MGKSFEMFSVGEVLNHFTCMELHISCLLHLSFIISFKSSVKMERFHKFSSFHKPLTLNETSKQTVNFKGFTIVEKFFR